MPFSKWKRIPVLWSWWHFAGPQTPSHTKVSATRPQNPQGLRRMAVPRRGRRPPSRQARRVTRPEANNFLHSSWGNDFSTIFHTQNSNKFQQPWSVLIFWTPKLTKAIWPNLTHAQSVPFICGHLLHVSAQPTQARQPCCLEFRRSPRGSHQLTRPPFSEGTKRSPKDLLYSSGWKVV